MQIIKFICETPTANSPLDGTHDPTPLDNQTSLMSSQQQLMKTGRRLVKHARYYW